MNRLHKFMMVLTVGAMVLVGVRIAMMPALPVSAQQLETIPSNLPATPLPQVIGNIINIVLSVTGIILFILFFYGGFQILTANGDDEKVAGGKKTIIQAVIGLLVILVSYAASQYIIGRLLQATGSTTGGTGGTHV